MSYPALVHGINERDEASGQVTLVDRHSRDVSDDKRFIVSHQLEVIRGTSRASNQFVERETGCFARGLGNQDIASPHLMYRWMRRVVHKVAHVLEPFVCVVGGLQTKRMVIDTRWWPGNLAVVGLGIEIDDRKVGFEELDTRDKGLTLDSILIQVIWVAVGGRHQDDSVGHQRLEQPDTDFSI